MSEPKQNTAGIPESITINGVTYSVSETPELQQFIQSVAKVEKSKLYSQLEALREQIKNLGSVQVTEDKPIDINALVESLKESFVTKEDLGNTLKSTVEEVVRPVLEATKKTQEDELNAYRDRLVKENEATCIPELVKGSTKEEIDASLKESIRLRSAYPPPGNEQKPYKGDPNIERQKRNPDFQAEPNSSSPTPQGKPNGENAPAVPHRPAADASMEPHTAKTMSMKEFAQKRDSLKEQLEALYGNKGTL